MIMCVIFVIQGCASPTTLKPVTVQNQQNLVALNNNVQILLALYEPLLKAANQSVIYQHIGKTEQEMLAVVGSPILPPPNQGWKKLFKQAADKRGKYLERYQFVQSAWQRGIEQADLEIFKREGWIYQAATDENFTPKQVHRLLNKIVKLKNESGGKNEDFFAKVEKELLPYDPVLQSYRASADEAQRLFAVLKQEITTQLHFAEIHQQVIANFAQVDTEKAFQEIISNQDQLKAILSRLGQADSPLANSQESTISLLTKQLSAFISKK